MINDHSATGNRSSRQACSESTPAGSLNATHHKLPRGKLTTGRGFAKQLGWQQLLVTIRLWSITSFYPSCSPSLQSLPSSITMFSISPRVNARAQTYNQLASSIFLSRYNLSVSTSHPVPTTINVSSLNANGSQNIDNHAGPDATSTIRSLYQSTIAYSEA